MDVFYADYSNVCDPLNMTRNFGDHEDDYVTTKYVGVV